MDHIACQLALPVCRAASCKAQRLLNIFIPHSKIAYQLARVAIVDADYGALGGS